MKSCFYDKFNVVPTKKNALMRTLLEVLKANICWLTSNNIN